jgi:hypothetical protein
MIINDLFTNKKPSVAEGMAGSVVFRGTGADGGKYEIIQSGPNDYMIHANGRHIDTYGSLQRAMSVLQNEVPGLTKGVAEGLPQTLRKFVPGYARREIDRKMDAEKFGKTDVDRDANYYRYKKIQDKLKEQGMSEGGNVFMPNIQNTPEYKAGFATGKLPVPHPEGTQQYANYYKGVIDKASPTLSKVGEGEQQKGADYRDPKEVDYDDEYDAMVARVKKLAGLGPMKTVYDPKKRQYRNMPTAQQPKK